MADMSAEERLVQIRQLLGLESEEGAGSNQNADTPNLSIPAEIQPEKRDTQSLGTDKEIPSRTNEPGGGDLILRAFQQARVSGKSDWDQMTTAALKSRMLSLTNHTFREEDYGVGTLTDFIRRHSDLVSLDTSVTHPIVKLLNAGQDSDRTISRPNESRPVRIRSDLWQAVLDRSSGETYSWDPDTAQVKTDQPLNLDLILPTVDEDVDRTWRRDFIGILAGEVQISTSDEHQLKSWSNDLLPAYRLPSHLIPRWNIFLTSHVVALLSDWFEQSGLEPPKDFYITRVSRTRRGDVDTERLRQLVLAVVKEMNGQELSNLILPPRAILRATRSRRNV